MERREKYPRKQYPLPKAPRGFRHVPGAPGYAVSRSGGVISCRCPGFGIWYTSRWHALKRKPQRSGPTKPFYYYVQVAGGKGVRKRLVGVHQMVLRTYKGPCPRGKETRHKNGIGVDNRLRNLAWGTRTENARDKKRHGTSGATLSARAIWAIRRSKKPNADLAEAHGVSVRVIRGARNNSLKGAQS